MNMLYQCKVCGYVYDGNEFKFKCPICGNEDFERID